MLKAEALTGMTLEMPKAQIVVELPNGHTTSATGFVIKCNQCGEPVIVIKTSKSGREFLDITGGWI